MWDQVTERLRECSSPASVVPFREYLSLLLAHQSRINLTGIENLADAVSLHLMDSLELLRCQKIQAGDCGIDVGSGAGLPGLPLAIALPRCSMALVDSRKKRIEFLRLVCSRLELTNTRVLPGRAEAIGRDPAYREGFDFAVARALAPPAVALEYCLPLVGVSGKVFLWVGPSFESDDVSQALSELGGRLRRLHEYTLHHARRRAIIEVTKEKPTPQRYPRKPGIPRKRPLR